MADAAILGSIGFALDRPRRERIADWLAVAVAVSLPWSTSATLIVLGVWLVVLISTLNSAMLRRELASAAGGLPVLLVLCGAVAMLWSSVSFSERIAGLDGYLRLLAIPLFLMQFRRSGRGIWVLYGFLASCTTLLCLSWSFYALSIYVPNKLLGVPVKDYIAQSAEFFICAFALLALAMDRLHERGIAFRIGVIVLAALFLANVFYIATGRTALVVIPVVLGMFGFRYFGWKGIASLVAAGSFLFGIAWSTSPILRERVVGTVSEVQTYRNENAITSAGLRLEFWKKSIEFVADAPWIGHGTGSMPGLFRRAAVGEGGAAGVPSTNPHNQYFAVVIELGLVGGIILIGMWSAHLMLFRGQGLIRWIGLVVVTQNIISSVFNSHLFDFFHGWLYVIGVGVIGGMVLNRTQAPTEQRK